MRLQIFCFGCVLLLTVRCKSYSYFTSPNDARNTPCVIHLRNGSTETGLLTIQLETGRVADNMVELKTEHSVEKIPIDSIAWYSHGSERYYLKQVDLDGFTVSNRYRQYLSNTENLLFLRLLNGPGDDGQWPAMNLYELFESKLVSDDGGDHYSYFLSLPTESPQKAFAIGGGRFVPRFEEKMSRVVAGCPALAEKISNKQNGYVLNQISLDLKKLETFQKIVEEYNHCR